MMSSDPLKDLLTPTAEPEQGGMSFRQTLRERTSRMIQRRIWRRRVVWAAAASLFFAAGMAFMAWFQRDPPTAVAIKIEPPKKIEPAPAPLPPPTTTAVATPLTLEWQAFNRPPEEKADLLLKAGRKYLDEKKDYDSALRCYRQALDSADASFLEISPEDDWLIMALKIDRRKEH